MFFQAKHPAVSADKLDTQLSTVTCSELRPLLQVCQPFGLVPYSLQTYQSSSRHYLVMGIKVALINSAILMVIYTGPFKYMRKPMESLLFTIVQYMIMCIHFICVSNVYIRCITQKEKTISILRRLETAIFHLKTLGILRKRETHHVRLRVLTYTFLFYVNVVITHVNYPRLFRGYYFEGFLFTTASALSNSIVFLIELQYIIFFYVIYRKFLLINDTFSQAKSFAHYKQLVIIHNRLCDLCYDVNEVFDQQILILITSHFTYIICNIYYVVVIFIEAMNGHVAITKHLSFIFLIVYWCGFKSVHLVWIVYYAAKTQNEGNKTHTHAQERDSQYFGQLLSKQNIHLTVCGLFPLDYTLLYTVVGTATTYWIILIQLQFLIPQQIPADEAIGANVTAST